MGKALYRKYRSRSLDEIVGQDHIKDTLTRALKSDNVSHAYLFTGPKGVGKTSVARILAYEVNDIPYQDEGAHLDIIEIDAASNRRIDEIRDLREKVNITPASSKYKVYIIDEVHMLTREAFNALLKTLEEPPPHVIFILATTEAHKVPETIVSRTQRFSFRPINKDTLSSHLQYIAGKEKIIIDAEALDLLAEHAQGSFRDSLSLLDQLSSYSPRITVGKVSEALGLPPSDLTRSLYDALKEGDKPKIVDTLSEFSSRGVNAVSITKSLSNLLREDLVHSRHGQWTIELLKELLLVPASSNPDESLEITLLSTSEANSTYEKEDPKKNELKSKENTKNGSKIENRQVEVKRGAFKINDWPVVLDRVKVVEPQLYTILRLAKPHLEERKLSLIFDFPLHEKKANMVKNLTMVHNLIKDLFEDSLSVGCSVSKDRSFDNQKKDIDDSNDPGLKAISTIFGSAKVLES